MKTARTFKGGRFMLAAAIALVAGEFLAWQLRGLYRVEISPVVVAFGSVGLVAAVMAIVYDGAGIEE
jgi:hypothetical protein